MFRRDALIGMDMRRELDRKAEATRKAEAVLEERWNRVTTLSAGGSVSCRALGTTVDYSVPLDGPLFAQNSARLTFGCRGRLKNSVQNLGFPITGTRRLNCRSPTKSEKIISQPGEAAITSYRGCNHSSNYESKRWAIKMG